MSIETAGQSQLSVETGDQSELSIETADQSQLSIETCDQSQLSIETADQSELSIHLVSPGCEELAVVLGVAVPGQAGVQQRHEVRNCNKRLSLWHALINMLSVSKLLNC